MTCENLTIETEAGSGLAKASVHGILASSVSSIPTND
jgi:hypothetical protein